MDHLESIFWTPGERVPKDEWFAAARSAIVQIGSYPQTREQLKREWNYMGRFYGAHKTFTDANYRPGRLYLYLKKRGLPKLAKPSQLRRMARIKQVLFWIGLTIACFLLWPYAKVIVIIVIGLSVVLWGSRTYYWLRR
jgi:dolichol kinase